jgi:hypothetical protein
MATNLLVIGPAGSGKTSLTARLSKWMAQSGISSCLINLDPGAERLPYLPDYDIRSIVRVCDLMEKEGLSPNGALIKASEIIESRIRDVAGSIHSLQGDFKIIDTPGQMELFLFRQLGSSLASKLSGKTAAIMLLDLSAVSGADYAALRLLGLIAELKLGVPSLDVISKSDLLDRKASVLWQERITAPKSEGLKGEFVHNLSLLLSDLEKRKRVIAVSSVSGEGLEALYKALGELFCSCGDLS